MIASNCKLMILTLIKTVCWTRNNFIATSWNNFNCIWQSNTDTRPSQFFFVIVKSVSLESWQLSQACCTFLKHRNIREVHISCRKHAKFLELFIFFLLQYCILCTSPCPIGLCVNLLQISHYRVRILFFLYFVKYSPCWRFK